MYFYIKKKAGYGDRRYNRRCVEDVIGGWMVGGLVEESGYLFCKRWIEYYWGFRIGLIFSGLLIIKVKDNL